MPYTRQACHTRRAGFCRALFTLLSRDPDPYSSNADVPSKATYQRLP